jgi:hypothetical protein
VLNALLPLGLIALSFANSILLRMFLFAPLSAPVQPLIEHWGLVYSDKPMFLTPEAAVLNAICWAPALYLVLCTLRYLVEIDMRLSGKNKSHRVLFPAFRQKQSAILRSPRCCRLSLLFAGS